MLIQEGNCYPAKGGGIFCPTFDPNHATPEELAAFKQAVASTVKIPTAVKLPHKITGTATFRLSEKGTNDAKVPKSKTCTSVGDSSWYESDDGTINCESISETSGDSFTYGYVGHHTTEPSTTDKLIAKGKEMESLFSYALIAVFCLFFLFYLLSKIKVVPEWKRIPVLSFGRYKRTLGPGINLVLPIVEKALNEVAINNQVTTIKMDEDSSVQTHDNIPVIFKITLVSRVHEDKIKEYTLVTEDPIDALRKQTKAVVSAIVSNHTLDDILHKRDDLTAQIMAKLDSVVAAWGMDITSVALSDIQINDDSIQDAIALKARAAKEAEAELVRAEMQLEISKKLSQAGELLTERGLQLKSFEVLTEMTRSAANNTVVIPSDALTALSSFCKAKC